MEKLKNSKSYILQQFCTHLKQRQTMDTNANNCSSGWHLFQ